MEERRAILRDVGVEAVRAHPGPTREASRRPSGTSSGSPSIDPERRLRRAGADGEPIERGEHVEGETIVVNGRRLPKPTEGERIPAPHEQSPTTPDGGNYTVWTSPTERHVV